MPAGGMRATGSPERRFGSPVSVGSAQSIPELFDDEKTVVSIASEPTGKGDDWPNPPHPANVFFKMLIGRIERGFDFLGYRFTRAGLSLARKTVQNFIEKTSRLYEQECRAALPAPALERYVKRWVRWTTSGHLLPKIVLCFG